MHSNLNVKPWKTAYLLENLTNPQSKEYIKLHGSVISRHKELAHFWDKRISIGKMCNEYMERKIFTDAQYNAFLANNKLPVEPQELKPIINSLQEHVIKTCRPGHVECEDTTLPPTAIHPDDMNAVLLHVRKKFLIDDMKDDACREGLVAGFPIWVWVDWEADKNGGRGEIVPELREWDSVLPGPFRKNNGTDIHEVVLIDILSTDELYHQFPHRRELIDKVLKGDQVLDVDNHEELEDQLDLDEETWINLYESASTGQMQSEQQGLHTVYRRVYQVFKPRIAYVSQKLSDAVEIPETWSEEEEQAWAANHPEYERVEESAYTLWETTVTSSGIILENAPCWYQNDGQLPGVCFVADRTNKKPSGAAEDLLSYILTIAISETEGLAQVQRGSGQTTFVKPRALRNPETFDSDMASDDGTVLLNDNAEINDDIKVVQKRPNTTFLDHSANTSAKMERVHNVNAVMRGFSAPSKSGISQDRDIQQGMTAQSSFVRNFGRFDLALNQMLLQMIPMFMTAEEVIQIEDEFGRTKEVSINVEEFSMQMDEEQGRVRPVAEIIANDLLSAKYRFVITPGDNSYTGKMQALVQFNEIFKAIGNSILKLDPMAAAMMFKQFPNRYAQDIGQQLEATAKEKEQAAIAQAQMEQDSIERDKLMEQAYEIRKAAMPNLVASMSLEEIKSAPEAFRMLLEHVQYLTQREEANQPQEPITQ